MKNFFEKIVGWVKNNEQKTYNLILIFLIIFLIVYTSILIFKNSSWITAKYRSFVNTNNIVLVETPVSLLTPKSFVITNNQIVVSTDVKTKFSIGEIVGIKHMGTLGIVVNKTIGFGGYSYEVIYKDNSGTIQKVQMEPWLLYHPQKDQITTLFLLN